MFYKKRRNVDTIVRDLHNMVEDLLVVKADSISEANDLTARINELDNRRTAALTESDRAAGVAEKIAELVA